MAIFSPTKPTWYLFVTPIAVVAIIITWVLRNPIQKGIGSTGFGVLMAAEVVGVVVGIYFHFSYFWNAGPAGKAVVGYELFRDSLGLLIGRGRSR